MLGRKTNSRFNRVVGPIARGTIIASLALSLSPVSAFAATGTSSPSGITLLAEETATQVEAPTESSANIWSGWQYWGL